MNTIQKIFLIGLIPFMFFLGCEEKEESLPYVDLNWIRFCYSDGECSVHFRGDVSPPSSTYSSKCIFIHLYKSEGYWEYQYVGYNNPDSRDLDDYYNVTYDER